MSIDPGLQRAMDALPARGVAVAHRIIAAGDEAALLPEEGASIASRNPASRRASGAARIVARQLMQRLGFSPTSVLRDASGAPVWPKGLVGSLAHDDGVAVAALARAENVGAIGIDVEPAAPLPADMLGIVAGERERRQIAEDPLRGRVLFAAKEAVYKAAYPSDRVFLEFADIEIDLSAGQATTRTGRTFSLRCCTASHIVVLAFA